MLYYQFNGYEGFKERFGMRECGNGKLVRRNKILLSYIKQPDLLVKARETGDYSRLNIASMTELFNILKADFFNKSYLYRRATGKAAKELELLGGYLYSQKYRLDELQGVCEDGDIKAVRYVNMENGRVFKKKAGRFFNDLLKECGLELPDTVRLWLCEEFQRVWEVYSAFSPFGRVGAYELEVNDDFGAIYDSDECDGDFHSCMTDKGYHTFYRDAVSAKAACLRRTKDGVIIARCVIFTDVHDEDGKVWRLAERQYATECEEFLKRLLVEELIKAGYIDGYKKVGVSCHDNRAYVDNAGEPLNNKKFWIPCHLENRDTLSYQDSFVYFDQENQVAYNYDEDKAVKCLDTTCGYFRSLNWDSYNERYTDHDVYLVYAGGNEYYTTSETIDDYFVCIDGRYYHKDDCTRCPYCNEWMLRDNEDNYSELTGEYYCCEGCMDNAEGDWKANNWFWSAYDKKYYEDEEDVVNYRVWRPYREALRLGGYYKDSTISVASLDKLIALGDVVLCDGNYCERPYSIDIEWTVDEWHNVDRAWVKNFND